MVIGIALIAAGLGLFLTSRSYFDVADAFNKRQAREVRERRMPRLIGRSADFNARWGASGGMWLGRAVGIAALVVGAVLVARA